jgi:putative Mn2+ efflux pump MntP
MNLIEIIAIAISLAMDSLVISVLNGCIIEELRFKNALLIAISFGFFQSIMPVIGWYGGVSFTSYVINYSHWIAFALLALIGGKMIYESFSPDLDPNSKSCMHPPTLLMLSLATSIDALAVGISFAFLKVNIIWPVILIGSITFIICLCGIYIGKKIGHFFENKLSFTGGIILIGIGIKIVIERLFR